ncbi:nuclear pore complex assembly-domain-containing protein [Desarmillaria tabescens]|uniref:Nuclear pore complex assembly-domain-containing protein n=1 Tax=Armillaria tabescens TaxID=1929756 RepID=A0AA39K6E2_ARMTA|nr:nuclear pore complex assembly-domain-containing protein [Desarmillaria tabescens]KAK0454059.1 nuclear pore complex assembly-domain-containing protein [Desarmillaria tabescens]
MEDEIQYVPRGYLSYFDVTDELFPWPVNVIQEIERRRAALNDMLLFDILLSLGGIREPDTLYPPRDVQSLERLLDAISASQYDVLKKDCLVYFLLKWHEDGRETKFEQTRSIPPQFCALSDAYWHLDAGLNVQRAVGLLSDSRLNRDYASKILHAISLSDDPTTLILKYVRTAKPLLTEPEDMKLYTLALADSNFFEAWQYQRSFNESDEMRPRLFNALLEWCITPFPRSAALSQLLGLPLSSFEQSILHTYALQPPPNLPPSSTAALQDLICVRLIESGNYAEAIKIDRQFSSISTLKGHHITQERRKMIQEIYASLPQVERTVLDLELEAQDAASTSFMGHSSHNGGDVSMSNSWEDIRLTHIMPTSINGKASPIQPPTLDRSTGFRAAPSGSTNNLSQSFSSIHSMTSVPNGASSSKTRVLPPSIPLSSSTSSTLHQSLNQSQQSMSSTSAPSSTPIPFESAAKRQNAFFQPQDRRKSGEQLFSLPNGNGHHEHTTGQKDIDMLMHEEYDESLSHDEDDVPPPPEQSFSESLFGLTPSVPEPISNGRLPTTNHTSKMPPGAFEDAHPDEEIHEVPAQPMRMATRHRTVKVPDTNLKRSIPGALMDDTDESEKEDEVAPLRSPSPPRRALRKGRVSATEARVTTDQSRRRSSRLSSVSHPEPVPLKKMTKSRKSTATVAAATTTTAKAKRKR